MKSDINYEDFFAKRLSQLWIQQGVSAREMSLAIGQNESYINRIENKKSLPSMQGFFYICEYLGVSPAAFFDSDEADPRKNDEFYKQVRSLPEDRLNALSELIRFMK